MAEKSSIPARSKAMSAAFSANDRARQMCIAIGGPRHWNDTKESWRARLARKIQSTERRVRALLSNNEKIRLSADEYLRIEALYQRAESAVASLSNLASDAEIRADHRASDGSRGPENRG